MNQGIESHIDWTASTKSRGERGAAPTGNRQQPVAPEKHKVMDTLLGKNNLSAADISGDDPYNATGRHFRR